MHYPLSSNIAVSVVEIICIKKRKFLYKTYQLPQCFKLIKKFTVESYNGCAALTKQTFKSFAKCDISTTESTIA